MAKQTQTYTSVYGGLTLEAVCEYTDNPTSNNSTVKVTLNLKHGEFYASALSGSYLSVAGVKKTYAKTISWSGGNTTTALTSQTVTVAHNSDGTGTCRIIGTFVLNGSYGSTSIGTMTIDKTLTLTKIPRASTIDAPASITTGSTLTVNITRANTSFSHKLKYIIGATTFAEAEMPVGDTSDSLVIPHSWLNQLTSATLVLVLSTYSGSTEIGSVSKHVALSVPSNATTNPSVSALTATSSVTSGTFANLFVQGKTSVILSATASAGEGATIVSYTFSGPNISSTTSSNTATTGVLQSSGSLTYTVTVKNSRGVTASKTVTISSQPYAPPAISYVSVQRCDASGNLSEAGTYAKYTVNSAYSAVNNKNTRTVTVAYSSNGGTSYSSETTLQAATDTAGSKTGVYGGGAFALAGEYTIRFTIKDAYGAIHTATAPLRSAARPINIGSNGKGVAIGGMSTKNAFECSMDADFNKTVNVDGATTIGGTLKASGATTVSGTMSMTNSVSMTKYPTIAGTQMADFVTSYGTSTDSGGNWTWRKWKSGRVEATFEKDLGQLSLSTKSGDGVYTGTGNSPTITYPANLFTKPPLVFPSLQSTGYTTMICSSVTAVDCRCRIWASHSSQPVCTIALYFVGWNI